MKPKRRIFRVTALGWAYNVQARNPGGACRLAFKEAIRQGKIKRQPASTRDGGFEGISVEVVK